MISPVQPHAPTFVGIPRPTVPASASAMGDMVTLTGPTFGDTVESIAVCGTVTGAPSMLGAAFGWGGVALGLSGVAAMTMIGVKCKEDRRILLPLALITGGIAGVAGATLGWPGAVVVTGLGAAYGWKCA